jgi:hypothetical protein
MLGTGAEHWVACVANSQALNRLVALPLPAAPPVNHSTTPFCRRIPSLVSRGTMPSWNLMLVACRGREEGTGCAP